MLKRVIFVLCLCFCAQFGVISAALAGDTVEPVDKGTINVGTAFGVSGITDGSKPGFGSELAIGLGVLDTFNVNFSLGHATESLFDTSQFATGLQLLYTPVDTDNFDFDIMLDFALDNIGPESAYSVVPNFELNFDLEPDMALWGLYARFALPIYSQKDDKDKVRGELDFSALLGTYFTIAEFHQILIEAGVGVAGLVHSQEFVLDPISIGYNVVVMEGVEITSELALSIPIKDEDKFSVDIRVGAIFDIPTL